MANIKICAADMWFSKCVREAADWQCQRCSKQYSENTRGLECAHYMTRGKWATRHDPLNVAALCTGCHFYIDSHPYEKIAWFEQYLGQKICEIIREKSEDTKHGLKKLKKEISSHYRKEYQELLKKRSLGATGKLEFVPF